ncbi:rhomboid family intramembrane serine protease [Flavimaricola marinus]|uniref:Rhomboid family protein n=1 Tax=Flavimaricola marinus TaxID=1819565 RepID=A0A238LHX0_9RHOB|nr:rhomboid family intramembrane serine protease [Flavimaricola marinus]SMY09279.1 Rhomboid family protein [Flavimaricola marinus]
MTPPDPPSLPQPPADRPAPGLRQLWPLWLLVALTCLPEIVLELADSGIVGSTRWRPLAYQNGAFWAGLLRDWQPNFDAQPWTMFATYALLHVGFEHLLGNMLVLVWLGLLLWPDTGAARFLALYAGAVMGGALAFATLNQGASPMVGASGAVFGLAAAAIVQHWQRRRRPPAGPGGHGAGLLRASFEAIGLALGLVALNMASGWVQGAPVAWQTHLGGALAGAVLGLLLIPWTPARR